ncbi:MAG: kynureninase [Bdellovibrionales bacterium]|nr:kynureninase [Bdellovibrionales bacterium]
MNTNFSASLECARKFDEADPLADFRNSFYYPKTNDRHDCIYLCGNSLGLQPRTVRKYVEEELEDWAKLGVEGHFEARRPWLPYHEFLTESLASLVGAKTHEVVAMNTLTVNLHLMLVSFYVPTSKRTKIVTAYSAFPSDRYAVASHIKNRGLDPDKELIVLSPQEGETSLKTEDIEAYLDKYGEEVALVVMDGVNYYSGQALEVSKIVKAAHRVGAKVGFDFAHGAGNLQLKLHDDGPDFAVWCSYKYLNGGPGCVAGCFVHERHAKNFELPRFAGWWGHNKKSRFLMGPNFDPIEGAEGWQLSNPPILPLASLRGSLDIFDQAGMSALREKSVLLTGYLEFLLDTLGKGEIKIITPRDPNQRGCQLSLVCGAAGKSRYERLTKAGVICDWREPDVIRVAPVPLYNSFEDVFRFVQILFDEF